MSLLRQVEGTVRDFGLLQHGDRVLVAVSGGADSTCLLVVLHKLARKLDIGLRAFHLNHCLRGEAAEWDARLVSRLCRRLKVPCTVLRANVRVFARRNKLSIEEAGRELRYRLLDQTARETGCNRIATAHNADDNAETVVMNLCRGSGLTGLSGIPVRRGMIVRPLLRVERTEIERFLAEQRIKYSLDLSNLKLEFRRNLVRHRLIPLLKRLNPQVVSAIARTSEVLRAEDDCMAEQVRVAVRRVARPVAGGYLLDTASLGKYNLCTQRRVLKALAPDLSFDDVSTTMGIAVGRIGNRRHLSGRTVVWKDRDGLFLGRHHLRPVEAIRVISVPGENLLPEFGVRLDVRIVRRRPVLAGRGCEVFDLDELQLPLEVRTRRPGDRFAPFGGRTRKLQDILVDDRIPRRERDRLPLVCDQQGILWAVGSRRTRRASVNDNTRRFMTLKCLPLPERRGAK
jgi:tRNA(Ile)-lysidine synthase